LNSLLETNIVIINRWQKGLPAESKEVTLWELRY